MALHGIPRQDDPGPCRGELTRPQAAAAAVAFLKAFAKLVVISLAKWLGAATCHGRMRTMPMALDKTTSPNRSFASWGSSIPQD